MEGLDLDSIKIPKGGERVYKKECIYSFEEKVVGVARVSISGCG